MKNVDGPGLAPAIFLGILTFILGAVLGTASLISQEVKSLSKTADLSSVEPGTVYYVKGDRLGQAVWEEKEEALKSASGGTVELSEKDLNQWSSRRLQIDKPSEVPEGASWMDKLDLTASEVNFRLMDSGVQLATELKMPGILGERSFLYQVKGNFDLQDGTLQFIPAEGTLGCAPLGSIPGIREVLFDLVISLYEQTDPADWLPESLEGLNAIEVSDGRLVLRRG